MLSGRINVHLAGEADSIGSLGAGETVGELSLLSDGHAHSTTAIAVDAGQAAQLDRAALSSLVRRRPDIGVILYRNLAAQLGDRLLRADGQVLGSR